MTSALVRVDERTPNGSCFVMPLPRSAPARLSPHADSGMHDTADWHRDLSPQDRDASSLGSESGLQSGGGGGEVHVSLQVDRRGEGFHAEDVQVVALTKSTDVRYEIPDA